MNILDNLLRCAPLGNLVIALAGVVLVVQQIKRRRREWTLDALKWLHAQISTNDFRSALRTIHAASYEELNGLPTKEVFSAVSLVAGQYDLLGATVRTGVFPKETVLMTEWKVLVPLWQRLEPFVKAERTHRNMPQYKKDFEQLAKDAWTYAEQHGFEPRKIMVVGPRDKEGQQQEPGAVGVTQLLYAGSHLHLYDECYGVGKHWEYVRRAKATSGVTIIAISNESKILIVEQYRRPLAKVVLELPAGLVGDEATRESIENAAKRELKEETQVDCATFSLLSSGPLLPGITDEINAFCLAEVESFPHEVEHTFRLDVRIGHTDPGESIDAIYAVPLTEIVSWLESERAKKKEIDLRIYAGLYLWEIEKKRREQTANNHAQ